MNFLSSAVGFIVGVATGAAGQYFGEKYTDQRRSQESSSALDKQWIDIQNRFPKIIAEMKSDVTKPDFIYEREFFVKSSHVIINRAKVRFEYHTDVHPDLSAALAYLEELGFIVDITSGNCPKYRMTEHFIDRLRAA